MMKFGKAQSIRVTLRWKQSTSHYRAMKIADESLKVYTGLRGADLAPVVLSKQELDRRTYNRNW